ncbi:tandem-95 repeat protein, partial [Abyssisolibacter fermentans]|uniref:tandem-95 repeat protein n=1 Tax=Abyssisolibacter fermentans TaxID=1766203 RepID=UPI000B085D89
ERIASEEEGIASEEERIASEEEGIASEEERIASEEEGIASEEEGVASEEEGIASEEERIASEEEGIASEEERIASEAEDVVDETEIGDAIEGKYDNLLDAQVYFMDNYTSLSEQDVVDLLWPEIELSDIEFDVASGKLKLHTDLIEDYDKEIKAYGYVWSYNYEEPTVLKNEGSVEMGQGEQFVSFEHFIDSDRTVYVRAYTIYDANYVGYSNQKQYSVQNKRMNTMMKSLAFELPKELNTGKTYFKDTGDDLDKLGIAVGTRCGCLKANLDIDTLPTESAYLVLRGKFGGFAELSFNGNFLGYIGASFSNEYYGMKISNNFIKQGKNTIEMYVYGVAWAKIDSISIVVDGGDVTKGEISKLGFDDWSIKYDTNSSNYYTDIYAKTTTQNINTIEGLKLVSSIGLYGQNHFSSSDYSTLYESDKTYYSRITLPDDYEKKDETGNWLLYSMIVDDKEVLTVESRDFYYVDSVGPRNFALDFTQDIYNYTNSSVTITATVDDLFSKPFSHIVLPDGKEVYDYKASYIVSENDEYVFKVVEPDGTETEFVHKVTNIDKTDPLISILGDSPITLIEESSYVDMGVTISDNLSGFSSYNPTIDYKGLNTLCAKPGIYTITYTIEDRAGNTNSTTRTIIVKNKPLEVITENITKNSSEVSLKGRIKYYGEELIIEKGLVWGCINNPTVEKNDGIQSLTSDIINTEVFAKSVLFNTLMDGVMYNVRAYAKTSNGNVVYGPNKTFEANDKNYGVFQLKNTSLAVSKGSDVTFDIERFGGSDSEVKVYYRTVNGCATAGTQFNDHSGYVTFGDGDSITKSVTIKTINYNTWEKSNREFYFEIYKIEGNGNIGANKIGTVKFIDDIDSIDDIDNNNWKDIWSTGSDYKSDSDHIFTTSDVKLSSGYDYWNFNADSFVGRGHGKLVTKRAAIRFKLQKYINNWQDADVIYKGDDWHSYEIDDFYTSSNGKDIKNANKVRLVIGVCEAGGWNDNAEIDNPLIEIKINDSTDPFIKSFHTINGNYAEGDTVYIPIKFSEIVNVSDLTTLNINLKLYDIDGSESIQKAAYVTGNNTDTLVFKFIVPENKYNTKLEFSETKFDNPGIIKDLAGNAFDGSAATIINTEVKIASTCHDVNFAPNGDSTASTSHSTEVTVSKKETGPATIIKREYLWANDTNTKIQGFKSFNSGDEITIEGATGKYYLHIRTKDDYGNETYTVSNAFILNNTEPTFLLSTNTEEWTKNDITITLGNIPQGVSMFKRQYKEGFFGIEDFDTGKDFVGNSFTVSQNGIYTVYLETETGKKYINSIDVKNIDRDLPEIVILTDGSEGNIYYNASTEVTASDKGNSQLNVLQYDWTNNSSVPTTGWINFKSGDKLEKNTSGTWYLHVKAIDNAGNERYVCSNAFIVDNNGPTINITGTNPDNWTNESVTININAEKDNLKHVMMPDLTTVEAVKSVVNTTYTVSKNGYYTFVAVDESGNTAEASINITRIDTDAPNVTVLKSQEDWTNSNIVLTISADDDASVIHDANGDIMEYSGVGGIKIKTPDSETFEDYTSPYTYTVSSNGLYKVSVVDSLGNATTRNINISNIDKTPPFVEADNTDYGAKNNPISVSLFYRDKEMGIVRSKEYKITNNISIPSTYDVYDGKPIILSNEGTYYIHYIAVDGVNNTVTGYFGPYTIDSSIPSITLQADKAGIYKKSHSAKILVDFNGLSEGDIKYQWTSSAQIPIDNWNNSVDNYGTITKSGVNGDYYLHIKVSSGVSNYYASRLFKFDNTPPVITVKGNNPFVLPYGDSYVEKGVEYSDTYDLWPEYTPPNLNIIKNKVLGTYMLNYIVIDKAGNSTTISRAVNVEDVVSPVISAVNYKIDEDNILSFSSADFVDSYTDDLTKLSKLKILSLPITGSLKLGDSDMSINQIIDITDIDNITYRAEKNWNGNISFDYSVFDTYNNESNRSVVNILVNQVNDIPMANKDIAITDEDNSVTFNVINNDFDIETDSVNLVVQAVTQGQHGTVLNNNDGTLTYTPDKNWHGIDSFTYTIKDSDNGIGSGTVDITVNPVNDLPTLPTTISVSGASPYKVNENITISWDGAGDADGDILVYELDYFDGLNWNSIETNIAETTKSFTMPSIDTKFAKLRIRTYDKKEWSLDYLESSIFEIDSTKPHLKLSTNYSDWINADITVNFSSEDNGGSGIADTEYSYAKLLSEDNWSDWTAYTSGNSFKFTNDGVYKLKVRTIDNAGNINEDSGEYKIDKTLPEAFVPNILNISSTEIEIFGTTRDSTANSTLVSGSEEIVYDYSIDGVYCGVFEADGIYTFKGLTPNKEYTFKMKAKDKAGNEIETVEVKQSTKKIVSNNANKLVKIDVNDKEINYIGKVTVDNGDGENKLNVSLDSNKLIKIFENTKLDNTEANTVSVETGENYDIIVDGLDGFDVKQMEDKSVKLEIKNQNASYTLPAKQINIDSIAETFGEKIKLKDIKVQIEISKLKVEEIKKIKNAIKEEEYELVVSSVNFEIQCSYNNKTVNVTKFNEYVERSITIPENVDYKKITTGVVVNEDGTIYHVPTKVVEINGKYYAHINSLTNSCYVLIWNTLEFTDVSKQVERDMLNDMGARLIVSGVGNDLFEPDRDITRAEFIAIVIKALGLNPDSLDNPFEDVKDSDWYCKYLATAYEYKIISGYTNGKFKPMDKISREEAFSIIARAMEVTGLKIEITEGEVEKLFEQYSDKNKVENWVKNYIAECIKAKIISFEHMDKISPKDSITRAECVLMIRTLLEKSDLI